MTILVIILLVVTLIALGATAYFFRSTKKNVERLITENEDLRDSKVSLERYFIQEVANLRSDLREKSQFISEMDEHHRAVVKDLDRRRQRLVDTYEHVLESHTLFPNYKPSHLSVA